jgi:hypothetical protein
MRRILFLLMAMMLGVLPLSAQTGLSDEQQNLLDELRDALETRDSWESYSRTTQTSTRLALTVTGTDTSQWRTDTVTLEATADIDHESGDAQGSVNRSASLASSEGGTQGERAQIEFIAVDGNMFVSEDGVVAEAASDTQEFADFRLGELVDGFEVPTQILDNATEVFDLGVRRDSRRRDIQRYEVLLDFSESLPLLDLDLDSFVSEFNGQAELGALSDAVIAGSSLRLIASVDTATGQLTETALVIEIAVELEGESVVSVPAEDGRFSLELSQEMQSAYFNINDDFDIQAP